MKAETSMKIWVDADACPGPVKDIVSLAANRRAVETIFVANKPLLLASSPYLKLTQVEKGLDVADAYIKDHANEQDLVITQDILLAHALVASGVTVIDPRGKNTPMTILVRWFPRAILCRCYGTLAR